MARSSSRRSIAWVSGRCAGCARTAAVSSWRASWAPGAGVGYVRPPAIFSKPRPPLSRYYKQPVGVVTTPPIDPIREGGAFDLTVHLGAVPSAHEDLPVYDPHPQFRLASPVLTDGQLEHVVRAGSPAAVVLDSTIDAPADARSLSAALSELGRTAVQAVRSGSFTVIVLSDRAVVRDFMRPLAAAVPDGDRVPIPMLLA